MNPKVHYHVYSKPPLVPILSQLNPAHTLSFYSFEIRFNIKLHVYLCLSSSLIHSDFPTEILYAFCFKS
jgi:hypothetical protein